jgi:hypothetical protein
MICHHSLFQTTVAIQSLQDTCPPPETFQGLQHHIAWCLAVTLIIFDFDYGNIMICWLEGEYINKHCDWTTVSNLINAVSSIKPLPGHPIIDYERAFEV